MLHVVASSQHSCTWPVWPSRYTIKCADAHSLRQAYLVSTFVARLGGLKLSRGVGRMCVVMLQHHSQQQHGNLVHGTALFQVAFFVDSLEHGRHTQAHLVHQVWSGPFGSEAGLRTNAHNQEH